MWMAYHFIVTYIKYGDSFPIIRWRRSLRVTISLIKTFVSFLYMLFPVCSQISKEGKEITLLLIYQWWSKLRQDPQNRAALPLHPPPQAVEVPRRRSDTGWWHDPLPMTPFLTEAAHQQAAFAPHMRAVQTYSPSVGSRNGFTTVFSQSTLPIFLYTLSHVCSNKEVLCFR